MRNFNHCLSFVTVLTSYCYVPGECADFASSLTEGFPLKRAQTAETNCSSILKLYRILNHERLVKQRTLQEENTVVMEYQVQFYSVTFKHFNCLKASISKGHFSSAGV